MATESRPRRGNAPPTEQSRPHGTSPRWDSRSSSTPTCGPGPSASHSSARNAARRYRRTERHDGTWSAAAGREGEAGEDPSKPPAWRAGLDPASFGSTAPSRVRRWCTSRGEFQRCDRASGFDQVSGAASQAGQDLVDHRRAGPAGRRQADEVLTFSGVFGEGGQALAGEPGAHGVLEHHAGKGGTPAAAHPVGPGISEVLAHRAIASG